MKTTLLFLLLFICGTLYGQPEIIPKKANTVIISDTLNQSDFYNKVTDLLFESGYGILSSDKVQGTISTTEKAYKNGEIKLNFLIKDHRVILRGSYKSDLTIELGSVTAGPSWSDIIFAGQRNSMMRNAWDEMYKLANAIPGTKEYLIK